MRYSDLAGTTTVAYSTFSYDDAARLTNLHHRKGSNDASIANYTYTFDNASRLLTEVLNGTTKTYTHDTTDQLTADGTNTFTYDGVGNRTNGSYTTGAGNRLTNDGTWTFTYDDEGNLTKKSKGASQETWTYGYDHRNQMLAASKRATDGGNLQLRADYVYDAFGNRIEKRVDNNGDGTVDTTQRYAYDGWKRGPQQSFIGNENWDVWADLDGSSGMQTRYLRGDVIDQVFALTNSDGSAYWLLTDRLGSNRDVVNGSGVVKDTIAYDEFGNIATETDANFRSRYAWTGRELDTETNLQYNRARYYDGITGRWTSQDPLGFDAGDSNLFRYARNRPLNAYDPSGLAWWEDEYALPFGRLPPPKVGAGPPEPGVEKNKLECPLEIRVAAFIPLRLSKTGFLPQPLSLVWEFQTDKRDFYSKFEDSRARSWITIDGAQIGNLKLGRNVASHKAGESLRRHIRTGEVQKATANLVTLDGVTSNANGTHATLAASGAYPFLAAPRMLHLKYNTLLSFKKLKGRDIEVSGRISHSLFPDYEVYLVLPKKAPIALFQFSTPYPGPSVHHLANTTQTTISRRVFSL